MNGKKFAKPYRFTYSPKWCCQIGQLSFPLITELNTLKYNENVILLSLFAGRYVMVIASELTAIIPKTPHRRSCLYLKHPRCALAVAWHVSWLPGHLYLYSVGHRTSFSSFAAHCRAGTRTPNRWSIIHCYWVSFASFLFILITTASRLCQFKIDTTVM